VILLDANLHKPVGNSFWSSTILHICTLWFKSNYLTTLQVYGICAVLSFFHQHLLLYPLTIKHPYPIEHPYPFHVYWDSNGMIEHSNPFPTSLPLGNDLRWLHNFCRNIGHQLQPFSFIFQHVAGHENKQSEHPLPFLNALTLIVMHRYQKCPPYPPVLSCLTTHAMPMGSPIYASTTMWKLKHALCNVAIHDMYFNSLANKF